MCLAISSYVFISNLHVPRTFITLPSADISSIMFVVSGSIYMLCFLTNLASTQSMLAPLSGSAQSVDNVLLLVLTLKLIIGVGHPGIFALATSLETDFLLFVGIFIVLAAFTLNCNFFLFLLLL